ncbi:MAG TPA: sucrose phosphorylase [Dehalococcoidales bacterium]|nr:sucrose phosphorylase [Dehalococcoidales bacterium]
MKLNNGVMLISYANSLGRNLTEMGEILSRHFEGAVTGLHILPFYPSSSDRGFSPLRYDAVDPELGSWEDLAGLSGKYSLMYDFMINHLSSQSACFRDFTSRKDQSPWSDLFIRYKHFWPGGDPTPAEVEKIYKRKPRAPYVTVKFADGSNEKIWCTFGDDQIDLNIRSEVTWSFIRENLQTLARRGAAVIRLDAFAYAVKKAGGTCFFEEPGIWEMLERVRQILAPLQVEILPEMHEHYTIQLKLAERGFWVYDFALPMLLLHSLYTGETASLAHWLRICPRRQFTTLDTHDGIGVVDVRGLLTDARIEQTRDLLFTRGANVKRIYNTEAYNNLDIYQINCTYYSALGDRDDAYITARAVQMFAPGIPQVYYVGLLAGQNDIELVEATKNGRDINRHSFTREEVAREVRRPVVQKLLKLLRFRNECPAFDGEFTVSADGPVLTLSRFSGGHSAELRADMSACRCSIRYCGPDGSWRILDL